MFLKAHEEANEANMKEAGMMGRAEGRGGACRVPEGFSDSQQAPGAKYGGTGKLSTGPPASNLKLTLTCDALNRP